MRRSSLLLLLMSCLLFSSTTVFAQEATKKEEMAKVRKELRRVEPTSERAMFELERSMESLERSMEALEGFEMPPMPEMPVLAAMPPMPEFPEMPVIAEIAPIHIEIPEINIAEIVIPEIAPIDIPEIDVALPAIAALDFDFDRSYYVAEYSVSREFRRLSETEELRVQALKTIARQSDNEALDMFEKVLTQDESAAVRYHAVRMLRAHLDNERAIDLLADRAQNDPHPTVKKTAIRLLGKSGSPRAVTILQKIIQGN